MVVVVLEKRKRSQVKVVKQTNWLYLGSENTALKYKLSEQPNSIIIVFRG